MIRLIRFWGNAMSRAFTGLSIEQLSHAESIPGKIQELHSQVPPVVASLSKLLWQQGVEDFETDGYSVSCCHRTLAVIHSDPETQSLWDQYQCLAGSINGLRDDPPAQSFPLYLAAYKSAADYRFRATGK